MFFLSPDCPKILGFLYSCPIIKSVFSTVFSTVFAGVIFLLIWSTLYSWKRLEFAGQKLQGKRYLQGHVDRLVQLRISNWGLIPSSFFLERECMLVSDDGKESVQLYLCLPDEELNLLDKSDKYLCVKELATEKPTIKIEHYDRKTVCVSFHHQPPDGIYKLLYRLNGKSKRSGFFVCGSREVEIEPGKLDVQITVFYYYDYDKAVDWHEKHSEPSRTQS
jgi:hypothetical protein